MSSLTCRSVSPCLFVLILSSRGSPTNCGSAQTVLSLSPALEGTTEYRPRPYTGSGSVSQYSQYNYIYCLTHHSPHTTYHTPSIMTGSSRQEISSLRLRPQLANSHGAHQDSISTYSEDNSIIIRPCHRSKDNKIFLFYSFLIKPETTILYNQRLIKHNHFYNLVIRKEEENLIRLLIIPNHHIISASINNSCRL